MNLKLIKSQDLWYTIGLVATDGSLSKDGKHIVLTSKDLVLLRSIKKALGLSVKIGKKARSTERKKKYYILQFSNVSFYRYLVAVGLTPKKSLTLTEVKVPDSCFNDFLRGVIDGDGDITTWVNPSNGLDQWCLRLTSGAPIFSLWLKEKIEKLLKVKGKFYKYHYKHKKNPIFITKFGKVATKIILENTYHDNCLALPRKYQKALTCLRSKNGWSRYGTMSTQIQ